VTSDVLVAVKDKIGIGHQVNVERNGIVEFRIAIIPPQRTPAMTQTPELIAASLTKAQREALLKCTPWDVCVGAGIAIAFCANGLLEDSTITDDGVPAFPAPANRSAQLLEKQHDALNRSRRGVAARAPTLGDRP
jgi:hypothetical protein